MNDAKMVSDKRIALQLVTSSRRGNPRRVRLTPPGGARQAVLHGQRGFNVAWRRYRARTNNQCLFP